MDSETIFKSLFTAAVAAVLIVFAACIYQYNDGVTSLRRQAVDRGCTVTPSGSDYIIDCKR